MLMRVKQLSLSLLLIAGSMAVGATPVLLHSAHNIEEYQLKNGMRVILAENPKENRVYMNTIYFTGSLNDPQGKGGLAHLLEHLAFKGTKDVPGEEFQRRLDQYTLSNNASTGYYATQYSNVIRAEQKAINQILYLEAQRMQHLVLQDQFIPKEIDIVKREREVRLDNPSAVIRDQIMKAAYGNQHLGRSPIGDLAELESIGLPELQQYYQNWYAPNNAVLVLTGKFNKAQLIKQIDQEFSPLQKRDLPQAAAKIEFDLNRMQQRHFSVAKGSDYIYMNLYMQPKEQRLKTALAVAPYLYSLEPSGKLYAPMVKSGLATGVVAVNETDQERNIFLVGAEYPPQHAAQTVNKALIEQVETSPANFNATELQRIKDMNKNAVNTLLKSSSGVMALISNYVIDRDGKWQAFFSDQKELQALDIQQVNQSLNEFLTAKNRISASIIPTPEDQKKAATEPVENQTKTLDQQTVAVEVLKDAKTYKTEVKSYVKTAKSKLNSVDQKIQRGSLENGVKYALFPTTTRDDKTYATISIDFGSAESLFERRELIGLTGYLVLRGSEQYERQKLIDESIKVNGNASVSGGSTNSFNIQISAQSEHFAEYFKFVLDNLKQPKFEQQEFELIRDQILATLDRSYTEPNAVLTLKLGQILEQYQPGHVLYHTDPERSKVEIKNLTNAQVKAFYHEFFNLKYAQVAVTGDFDAKNMQQLLAEELGDWPGQAKFERILPKYKAYPAQKHHVFAEPREFGSYAAVLTLPVNSEAQDSAALTVFNHILGNSQLSSRLAQELRENNGLVYGFDSSLNMNRYVESGALTISANYSAGQSARVSEAIHKVLNELIKQGVTEQELEQAKAAILKRRLTNLEDERNIHRMLTNQLEHNENMQSRIQRDQAFAKLTIQDLNRVIKTYLKPNQLVEVMADQYGKTE